jgi:hypothetical protein
MDFDNRPTSGFVPCTTSASPDCAPDVAPLHKTGQWQFRSDVVSDPYKTGWVFERRARRQALEGRAEADSITFQCHGVVYGRMKIGYTASYGKISSR